MNEDWKFTLFFFAYGFGAMYSMFSIATEFNLPFTLAFKYLTIPLLITSFIFVFKMSNLFFKNREIRKWKQILLSFVLCGIMTLLSGPYISLANALLQPQEKIIIEGHITDKFLTGKHQESAVVVLDKNNSLGEPYKFYASKNLYKQIKIGDDYRKELTRGGLGFVYNWK